jgi:hypothetical protein
MTSNTRLSLSLPVVIAPTLFPLSAVLAYYRAGSYCFTAFSNYVHSLSRYPRV